MIEFWFGVAAVMLAGYVILDGFDLGAGALHLFVARTDAERRQVLAAIGPFWDGNEVWLLALGGVLFVAFPHVLASGLSGFYFAIFLVLWSLMLRAVSLEFRSHLESPLWRAAWDTIFSVVSAALPVLFGVALGNLLRGVPLDSSGWFAISLFTDFSASDPVGLLDWYTVLVGVFALVAIAAHGAIFLAWKTDAIVQSRARRAATWSYLFVAILWPVLTWTTSAVHPDLFAMLTRRPIALATTAVAMAGLVAVGLGLRRARYLLAFVGSSAFLIGVLAATAASVFPVMLRATGGDSLSLTAYNAGAPASSLRSALGWWVVGFPIAIAYFVVLFRLHRGKAIAATGRDGY
jgi:cytochrome d ubiquinol oxidase subunit II